MIRTLKILIDTLFVILCLGILGFIFILPFEIFSTKIVDIEFQGYEGYSNLPFLYWMVIVLSIITYILFLIGLNYLRKTANHFISTSFYTLEITKNLKRCGILFILSAIIMALAYVLVWGIEVSKGVISLVVGTNIMIPLFLCIMGFFFILQSKVLDQARLFEEDSNLAI